MVDCNIAMNFAEKVQGFLKPHFHDFGVYAAKRPLVSVIPTLIALLIGIGMLNLTIENRSVELWVPRSSENYDHVHYLDTIYGSDTRGTGVYVDAEGSNTNMLEEDTFAQLLDLTLDIFNIEVTNKAGEVLTFWDGMCAAEYVGGPCAITSIMRIFDYDPVTLRESYANGTALAMISAVHAISPLDFIMGNIQMNETSGLITSATAINQYMDILPDIDGSDEVSRDWEGQVIEMVTKDKYPLIRPTVITARSFDDEITRVVFGDVTLFLIAMIFILLYLSMTLGSLNALRGRVLLSFASLLILMSSIVCSFGIVGIFEVPFNSICIIMPFILLGVGVDDIIVIVDTVNRFQHVPDIPERVGCALAEAGVAITLTSVTAVVAFFVGSFVDMPGIATFCIVCGIAFLANYILQLTAFTTFLAMDERRIAESRHTCFAWRKIEGVESTKEDQTSQPKNEKDTGEFSLERTHTMEPPPDQLTLSEKITRRCLAPVMFYNVWSRLAILLAFFGLTSAGLYGLTVVEIGLPDLDVVPDDSYIVDAYDVLETHWENRLAGVLIYLDEVDYSKQVQRDAVFDLMARYEAKDYHALTHSWLLDMNKTLQYAHDAASLYAAYYPSYPVPPLMSDIGDDGDLWQDRLNWFLNISEMRHHTNELIQRSDGSIEIATFALTIEMPLSSTARDPLIDEMNNEINGPDAPYMFSGFSFSEFWLFTDIDTSIPELTELNMLVTLLAVSLVLACFIKPPLVLAVALCVAMIDVNLLGLMAAWDVKLNAISFICLVMSIGISVDYCVHLGHAFDHSAGLTRVDKSIHAVHVMGTSVMKGGFTTFLGVMILSTASSVAFRTFFKMLFGTIVLGISHGLLFLPVLLSFVGPMRRHSSGVHPDTMLYDLEDENEKKDGNESMHVFIHPPSETVSSNTTRIIEVKEASKSPDQKADLTPDNIVPAQKQSPSARSRTLDKDGRSSGVEEVPTHYETATPTDVVVAQPMGETEAKTAVTVAASTPAIEIDSPNVNTDIAEVMTPTSNVITLPPINQ